MKKNVEALIALLRYGGIEGTAPPDCSEFTQWPELFELAAFHNALPVIYAALSDARVRCTICEDERNQLRRLVITRCLSQAVAMRTLRQLMKALAEAELKAVLFKGATLACLYKEPSTRISCDADILIRPEDYDKAADVLIQQGFAYQRKESQLEVKAFVSERLSVDLHLRLWGDMHGKHVAIAESLALDCPEKTRIFDLDGLPVNTLGYQEYFIYLLIHMAKHFIIKGAGLRHLLDISLYYNAYREHIDVPALWRVVADMGFDRLYCNLFYICCEHFCMDPSIFDESRTAWTPTPALIKSLLDDIAEAGVFGTTPERPVSFSVAKGSYYLGLKRKSKILLLIHMIFPPRAALPQKYRYAKKNQLLLPVAWGHRLLLYVRTRMIKRNSPRLRDSILMTDNRIRLLEQLNLTAPPQE